MIAEEIKQYIKQAVANLGLPEADFALEHPTELSHGDYAANVAMVLAKQVGKNPRELAEQIVVELEKNKLASISKIEVAGSGFINFYLTPGFFAEQIGGAVKASEEFGKNQTLAGQKIIIEHTQPNPFKEFHIGHLMNNTIGEALARILKMSGAEAKEASYHGDVGLHVAKTIWGMKQVGANNCSVAELGQCYASGSRAYEESDEAKKQIIEINKHIYDRTDEQVNNLYDLGRKASLDYFNDLYKKLGSSFDFSFYESESGPIGKSLVEAHPEVFVESEGATVFRGEDYGLHTRVFLNKEKLPTYEAKELGLAQIKREKFKYDLSLTITASEQDAFFKVVEVAIGKVFPDLDGKLKHLSHGMLRLPTGKMSSRTGDVITAESMIAQVGERVREKIEASDRGIEDIEKLVEQVAIAAIKFSILKQAIGRDIIFDIDKSISFEGDSGPYLQYTYVRTKSIIKKAKELGIEQDIRGPISGADVSVVEKLVYRLPEVIEKAAKEYAPQHIVTYLLELASAYNSYYSANKIIDTDNKEASPYRIALTAAVNQAIKNGLTVLGIPVPERM